MKPTAAMSANPAPATIARILVWVIGGEATAAPPRARGCRLAAPGCGLPPVRVPDHPAIPNQEVDLAPIGEVHGPARQPQLVRERLAVERVDGHLVAVEQRHGPEALDRVA